MSTLYRYALPVEETHWKVDGKVEASFTWDYDARSEDLLNLYGKGKRQQWDAATRIDWDLPVNPEDPMEMDETVLPMYGTPMWAKLSEKQKVEIRYHNQVYTLSQFLHGEQGALVCSARIVQDVPTIESKFYAATQVMDEARHVEAFRKLLTDKYRMVYPISPPMKDLLEKTLGDPRWDFTYLGMQVLIEGLALVAFQSIRDYSKNVLCRQVNAYVMQDEARHVAFGRMALKDYYPQLTEAERREREDFVIEGSIYLAERLRSKEMWEKLGYDPVEVFRAIDGSDGAIRYRMRLFSRIVPTVRDIGLWSPRVQKAFTDLGVMKYATTDADAMLEKDSHVAEEFDRQMKEGWRANA